MSQLRFQLTGVVIEAVAGHPNKMKFTGVLCRLDEPSTKPPGGAQGHRILVPSDVAATRLDTLKGMGLNYAPDLDSHSQRHKVGVIDKAWIQGKDLCVSGHVWKHDFPEATKDLKQAGLGMSMELGDVSVQNPNASVWTLMDFTFLGATILWREAAAYYRTQAIAARADKTGGTMPKTVVKKTPPKKQTTEERIASIAAAAAASVVKTVLAENNKQTMTLLSRQTKSIGSLAASMEELSVRIGSIETSAEDNDDINAGGEDDEDVDDVTAAGKKKAPTSADDEDDTEDDDDSEDEGDEDIDSEADDEMDAELEELGEAGDHGPGEANKDTDNHGDDTTLDDTVGPSVKASIERLTKLVRAQGRELKASKHRNKVLAAKLQRTTVQVKAAATTTARRSLSPEVTALLSRANIDASDMFRTGTKLSVGEVDSVLANFVASSGSALNTQDRMTLKNQLYAAGLMEDGSVNRSNR